MYQSNLIGLSAFAFQPATSADAFASASKAVVAMPAGVSAQQVSSQSVRLATMVVTTFPIMCVYPFLQKYFVKGMLIGSIKG